MLEVHIIDIHNPGLTAKQSTAAEGSGQRANYSKVSLQCRVMLKRPQPNRSCILKVIIVHLSLQGIMCTTVFHYKMLILTEQSSSLRFELTVWSAATWLQSGQADMPTSLFKATAKTAPLQDRSCSSLLELTRI